MSSRFRWVQVVTLGGDLGVAIGAAIDAAIETADLVLMRSPEIAAMSMSESSMTMAAYALMLKRLTVPRS